jgi:hypothetical protein
MNPQTAPVSEVPSSSQPGANVEIKPKDRFVAQM